MMLHLCSNNSFVVKSHLNYVLTYTQENVFAQTRDCPSIYGMWPWQHLLRLLILIKGVLM